MFDPNKPAEIEVKINDKGDVVLPPKPKRRWKAVLWNLELQPVEDDKQEKKS